MKEPAKIAFCIEEFSLGTPAQQLLDRFLLGYPRNGEFQQPVEGELRVHMPEAKEHPDLRRRSEEHGLVLAHDFEELIGWATGLVIVPKDLGADVNDSLISQVLTGARANARCFLHGNLGSSLRAAREHASLAKTRSVGVLAGTPLSVCERLPAFQVEPDAPIKEALIVVKGPAPRAESDALDSLLPLLEQGHGEFGVCTVLALGKDEVWQAAHKGVWSWDLLAAAISRSDSPQGDPAVDGRTQDLVALGLVPKLARDPRALIVDYRDGLRATILVLDGVINDYNFALRTASGSILSAQLYRPPKPAQHGFSRLAAVIEDFLGGAALAWSVARSVLGVGLLDAFQRAVLEPGRMIETPEL